MRVMAIDYGKSHTGVAVSDGGAVIAGEAWVMHERSSESLAHRISEEASARGAGIIVVGFPINMDGSIGDMARGAESLAELLRLKYDGEVILWDERMTTIQAHNILTDTGTHGKKRKKIIDAVAASMILESFLSYLQTHPRQGVTTVE